MIIINMKIKNKYTILSLLALTLFVSCARMGNPDGGGLSYEVFWPFSLPLHLSSGLWVPLSL